MRRKWLSDRRSFVVPAGATFPPGLAWGLVAAFILLGSARSSAAQASPAEDSPPSVGQWRTVEQLFLPGTQLQPRPLTDERQPIVLRVIQAFPQGTLGFRYDLTYCGYEAGNFDLRDYLERVDQSSTVELPPIPVTIRSVLAPGQVEPNPLPESPAVRLGGYRRLMILAVVLWLGVFAAMLTLGWRRRAASLKQPSAATLAELLRPRLVAAIENRLDNRQFAELERMLIAMWRQKLRLQDVPPSALVGVIRQHPESGELMRQLERWIHDPACDRAVDLNALLKPLQSISAAEWDVVADVAADSERAAIRRGAAP